MTRSGTGAELSVPDRPRLAVNETAAAVWELCDGQTTVAEMVEAMTRFFDADADEIRRGVEATVAELVDLGYLELTDVAGRDDS